ncbi:beta-glucosidase [Flavobacterium subsaxonicum]|uniref:Glycoside hydrolase n=1 Tax=Flavobacterium subsaxonicum WB 4.1-42 = DSM 21790 TaxID=1121898 RepID=A0A0A2MEK7_9FLAO|nr:glycoside hydrolase family 3 N-terminal domain-containing protein [Flavobacterium subsaxonicum]KGO91117.1 glycoside hydrolase [Flavobacterium subsaxonicum WB 4.1-42 = DSM 21790]
MTYTTKLKAFVLFAGLWHFNAAAQKAPQLGKNSIDDVINAMTVEEKASMLIGSEMFGPTLEGNPRLSVPGAAGATFPIKRLGIPPTVLADGPAGLRIQPTRDNDKNTYYATAFPVGTALASTWNIQLIEQVGKAIGNEVKEYGADVLLAPAVNIHRNPLNGRNFEYYSEDPLISGEIAAAYIAGVQANGVGTSIKHFAANSQETNRLSINEHISERAMREIYLRGFEIAIKKAQPWTVMSSYNKINGVYTSASTDLLNTILREEWGYKGFVMSDWFGGYEGFENLDKLSSNVVAQLTAGNDLLMPGTRPQYDNIVAAIKSGALSKETVHRDIKRILQMVVQSPAFKKYKFSNKPDLKANAQITRQAATEGMVLLKNDNNILPYKNKATAIAVFGTTSYNFITGGTGSGDVNEAYSISLLQGLTNAGYKPEEKLQSIYMPYVESEAKKEITRREKEGGILAFPKRMEELELSNDLLLQSAKSCDIALITIGRNSGENTDRQIYNDFYLAQDEVQLINHVSKVFHAQGKKVVVVLNVGGAIETSSWKDKVDGILLAWQPGQEGGNSVVDVLSGNVNPSGKLTMTLPVDYNNHPSAANWLGTPVGNPKSVLYEEGIYVGYRYFNTFGVKPSYEFGYGKSYTNFTFSDVTLSSPTFQKQITVSVKVTNIGAVAGKQVVQLYLAAPALKTDKPESELKAFAKTKILAPGESQVITLVLNAKELASFVEAQDAWVAEAGTYTVKIGASSLDIKATKSFTLNAEQVVEKTHDTFKADTDLKVLKSN